MTALLWGIAIFVVGIVIVALIMAKADEDKRAAERKVIVRTYTNPQTFESDANSLNALGYSITAVSGGGKHFSAARATVGWVLAGPLGLLFSTGKTPILVTYTKLPPESVPLSKI